MSALHPPRIVPLLATVCGLLLSNPLMAGVDSVVTFNELQYHPAEMQMGGEWIELKNQNSVDVDLSGWRLDGGVDFVFPAGTVIRAGKYVVVAADPAALMMASGLTTVLGPMTSSLSNRGESITLKNNNDRRMDEIEYADRAPWPVAADGSGATLAKYQALRDSELPENWRASREVGVTPGAYNFTPQSNDGTIPPDGVVRTVDRYYKFDGTAADSAGRATSVNGSLMNGAGFVDAFPSIVGSGQALTLNGINQYVNIPDSVQPTAYTLCAWVRPDVIRAQSIVLRSNASGPASSFSHQLRMTIDGKFEHFTQTGTAQRITGSTVAVAGQWYHVAAVATSDGPMKLFVNGTEEGTALTIPSLTATGTRWMVGSNSGGGMSYFLGQIDEVGIWHGAMDASQVGHVATGFKQPTETVVKNLALGRRIIAGTGAFPNLAFDGFIAPDDYSAANVTDGSASDVPGSSYWLGRDGVTNESFVLDLGGPVEISQLLLRNTHHHQSNNHGTGAFRILAANAVTAAGQLVNASTVLNGTLTTRTVTPPTPAGSPIPADGFTSANGLTPTTARYLQFEALSSSYAQNVGLNEIEVFGTPEGGGGVGRPAPMSLVINEITGADAGPAWLELYNYGTVPLTLSGFILETSGGQRHVLPPSTLAAGGFLVLEESTTGLRPAHDDAVFLLAVGKSSVIDAVRVKAQAHQLRRPALAGEIPGEFLSAEIASHITPGAANQITLATSVVINEIMYHRRPQFLPYVENPEEWIELHNTSGTPVDLGGWSLTDAVTFSFPPGTILPPQGYLCVSNDAAAFAIAHPGVPVTGSFSGGLSNRGDRIILRNNLENPVDEVFYRDKEPWPIYTDGLGCSLELKNPEADNSVPESWADSDESSRSEWKEYTFTDTARTPRYSPTITPTGTTAFHELRMGLLEEGEVLVDDISVRQITTAPTVELIQNGAFSTPLTPVWRVLGNHGGSSVVEEAGNPVLQVRATGPLFYMHNLLETTFKAENKVVPVVNGRQYTITLRAKWLRGCPWLHTEFYYNKVAKTFLLDLPAASGTPGVRNSVYTANPGPTFSQTIHQPAVPPASTPITVSTRVSDPQGVSAVAVKFSVNGGAFQSAPMLPGLGGLYSGVIPGQSANATIQFYVEGSDAAPAPALSTWPAAGPASRAMIKIKDTRAVANKQNLRIITTAADATALANTVNTMSNQRRGCTIIHNEQDIFYNGKVRLRGSMFSRGNVSQAGESVTFPADNLFRGTHRTVSIRRSGMNEILVKHAINRAGGLPDNYNDIIQMIGFRADITGPARMEMERFSNSWLDEFYPEGSEGTLFKMEGIRVPTKTFANGTFPAGNPEGIKNLSTDGIGWVVELDLADLGPDGEQYRHGFRWLNNFSRNDNARFVQMCRTLSLPATTPAQALEFEQAIEPLIDVDEWMRCMAMMSLFGIDDAYGRPGGGTSNPHNLNFHMPPTPDGKISAIPWDWNFVFAVASSAPLTGDKNIQKVIARPRFKRLFLGHLKNIIETTFNTAYMTPWLAHYGTTTGESYTAYSGNINARRTSVLSQINAQIPPVAFSITTNNGAAVSINGATAVIEGDGWVDVRDIRVNGSPDSLPVTWLDGNSWRLSVPLAAGEQTLNITAHNAQGIQVGADTLVITNTSITEAASAANIVISEVHYHPATPQEQEFIEIMNISATHPVDMCRCVFSAGPAYAFPEGTILAPGARFTINASQFLNATGLNNAGERIRLEAAGGVVIKEFVYDDAPPWPIAADGTGPSLVLIAPETNPDHTNPFNWRLSMKPGGNPGTSDTAPLTGDIMEYAMGPNPAIRAGTTQEGLEFTVPRIPNADAAEIIGEASSTLATWLPAELVAATPDTLTFRVPASIASGTEIFMRARVRVRSGQG